MTHAQHTYDFHGDASLSTALLRCCSACLRQLRAACAALCPVPVTKLPTYIVGCGCCKSPCCCLLGSAPEVQGCCSASPGPKACCNCASARLVSQDAVAPAKLQQRTAPSACASCLADASQTAAQLAEPGNCCHTQLSWRQALKVLELEQHAAVELSELSFRMLGVCLKHSNRYQVLATSLPFTHCSGLMVHPDNSCDL